MKPRYLSMKRPSAWRATLALFIAACNGVPTSGSPTNDARAPDGTLGVGIRGTADVALADIVIQRVDCSGETIEPFMTTERVDARGVDSSLLSTFFFLLDPGCYDVVVLPLREDGTPSASCAPVAIERVTIVSGTTTEIAMASQCNPPDSPSWEFWNAAPAITEVSIEPDKFVAHCNPQTVCLTVVDFDADPVEIEWSQESGIPLAEGPKTEPMLFDEATGKTTQCATIRHAGPGRVGLSVKVYDLMLDESGNLVRMEDYFKSHGVDFSSHETLLVPSFGISTDTCPCVPHEELCDLIDNDCNTIVDDGLACAGP